MGRRKRIQRFDEADSLKRNAFRGAVAFSGFDGKAPARCDMPSGSMTAGICTPEGLEGFGFEALGINGLRSIADHVELAWSKPNAAIVADITGLSAKGYDSLTFRIAVVRPMGQEVMVTLTDSAGKTATVAASDFTNALYNAPSGRKAATCLKTRTCRWSMIRPTKTMPVVR